MINPGVLNQISFKKESTWGTTVTPDKSLPVKPTGGITTNADIKTLQAIKNQLPKNYDAIIGNRKHEGDYSLDLFPDYPAYFILSALGATTDATASGETVVYTHTITETAAKPSFTIEQAIGANGENVRRFSGVICDSFKISAKAGEVVTLDAKLQGKSQAIQGSKISGAFISPYVRPFNFADVAIKVGGSTLTEFLSFELEYKSNLEMIHGLGSNDPVQFSVKPSEVSGKIELMLDATTLTEINNYLSKTYRSLEFIATGDAVGATSNYKLDITLPSCVYKTAETKITDSYNMLSIDFDGLYDTSTSKLISAVVTNTLATLS